MRVCVYCASIEGIPPHYLQLAADVGAAVGDRGWELVSGGGRSAMMGALAIAARKHGARTVGVIPHAMIEREWPAIERVARELQDGPLSFEDVTALASRG